METIPWIENHPEAGPSTAQEFVEQFQGIHRELEKHGVRLIHATPVDGAFCQAFARDVIFTVRDLCFRCAMSADYRKREPEGTDTLLSRMPQSSVIDLTKEGPDVILEGGDVRLLNSDLVLVGTGEISNGAGVSALREHLTGIGVEVRQVSHSALHLDCCLAPLPNGKALYDVTKLSSESLQLLAQDFPQGMEALDQQEASHSLAANMLWINEHTVLSSKATPLTNERLRAMGFKVIELQIDSLNKVWGGIRCAVAEVLRDPIMLNL